MFNNIKVGSVEGTGAAINVPVGFKPTYVKVVNIDSENPVKPSLEWLEGMAAASAHKQAGNVCLSNPGVVIGSSSAATIKITNTTVFLINGIFKSKSTAETAFTATTHDITAVAGSVQEACYLVSLNASGTVTITKGTTATGAGNAVIPETPDGNCAIGYLRLAVAAGSTDFDASTDLLSAGHLTDTFYSFSSLGGPEKITAAGISQYAGSSSVGQGFTIGADTDVNVSGETIEYVVLR